MLQDFFFLITTLGLGSLLIAFIAGYFDTPKSFDMRYKRRGITLFNGMFLKKQDGPDKKATDVKKLKEKADRDKLQESKKNHTLVSRAQDKIDDFADESDLIVALLTTTYTFGIHEVLVHAEFLDGSLGIYLAKADPKEDGWTYFDKVQTRTLRDIAIRSINRQTG